MAEAAAGILIDTIMPRSRLRNAGPVVVQALVDPRARPRRPSAGARLSRCEGTVLAHKRSMRAARGINDELIGTAFGIPRSCPPLRGWLAAMAVARPF